MRAIIFANGNLGDPSRALEQIQADDWLIAANGGSRLCQDLGLKPGTVIGDFDSLSTEEIDSLLASGAEMINHPARKDETDLELAIHFAQGRGADRIVIFGALGLRWDQTLANLLLPAKPGFENTYFSLIDGNQTIRYLRSGQTLKIRGEPGDTLSLIPLHGNASGVTTSGLEFALTEGTLSFGSTLGISNVLTRRTASIHLEKGLLLCVHIQNQTHQT